jgi:hypothetical protein
LYPLFERLPGTDALKPGGHAADDHRSGVTGPSPQGAFPGLAWSGSPDDPDLHLGQRLAHTGLEWLALMAAIGVELEKTWREQPTSTAE